MSDEERSMEEIQRKIDRRQEDLSEDLEELEYRLSRRGVKDRTREKVSSGAHAVAERASSVKDQAAAYARRFGSRAGRQVDAARRRAASGAKRNGVGLALLVGTVAIGLGVYLARRRRRARLTGARDSDIERGWVPLQSSTVARTSEF